MYGTSAPNRLAETYLENSDRIDELIEEDPAPVFPQEFKPRFFFTS